MKSFPETRRWFAALSVGLVVFIPASRATLAVRRRIEPVMTLRIGGLDRTYRLSTPPGRAPRSGFPLVIQLHGGGGSGATIDTLTGMNDQGRRSGFAVASPDGIGTNWNDGRVNSKSGVDAVDDIAFMDALIDASVRRAGVDPTRVYLVGISNGAFMANRYACERADRVAGIGLVAGTMAPSVASTCVPSKPLRVIDFHGTADPLVPIGGGTVSGGRGEAISVDNMLSIWTQVNRCRDEPAVANRPPDVSTKTWTDCTAAVAAYRIEGAGHTWPGGSQYAPVRLIGTTSTTINASEEMWRFFSAR